MNDNKDTLLTQARELYDQLERDKELYKEFLKNEDSFLIARGLDPKEIKTNIKSLIKERMNLFKDVLQDHEKNLDT